jgi:L,D-transpeptidase ErfK/SrfK
MPGIQVNMTWMRGARAATLVLGLLFVSAGGAGADAPADDLVGSLTTYEVGDEETLLDVARRHDLGFVELVAANPGVDPWMPGKGRRINLPSAHILPDAPRQGIVINLAELRLYYFPEPGAPVRTYPIGVGRIGMTTPLGHTKITRKQANPVWFPTAETRADDPELPERVPSGPDNPLGFHALYLGWPTFVVHGTNKPWGIGRRVSRGCIRLYPEDIERLFDEVGVGTHVTVVDQSVKAGWRAGELYLEVHPAHEEADQVEDGVAVEPLPIPGLSEVILKQAGGQSTRLDWTRIREVEAQRRGIPVRVTL